MIGWTLLPEVLEIHPDHDTQRKIGAGQASIQDPRLMLLSECHRGPAVENLIKSNADLTGAVWLAPGSE